MYMADNTITSGDAAPPTNSFRLDIGSEAHKSRRSKYSDVKSASSQPSLHSFITEIDCLFENEVLYRRDADSAPGRINLNRNWTIRVSLPMSALDVTETSRTSNRDGTITVFTSYFGNVLSLALEQKTLH